MTESNTSGLDLHVLIVDGDDTETTRAVLRRAGYGVTYTQVTDARGFLAALDQGPWDMVLSEYTLGDFGAYQALTILQERNQSIPLIVFTRAIEDAAVPAIMAAGARDVVEKTRSARLAPALARELAVARACKNSDASKQKVLEDKLQQLREQDTLTGLYNRHCFFQKLTQAVEQAKTVRVQTALFGFELHGLRAMNDAFGHAACDRLLLTLSRQLRELIGTDAVAARVGGGQFALLAPSAKVEMLKARLEELARGFRFREAGKPLQCNLSVQQANIDGAIEDKRQLLGLVFKQSPAATAPAAATAAAEAAAPTVVTDPALEQRLRLALERNALQTRFQHVAQMCGEPRDLHEVQCYLTDQNGAMQPLAEVMTAAERCGLAGKIDRWLAQQSINTLSKLHKQGRNAALLLTLSNVAIKDTMLLSAIHQHMKALNLPTHGLYFQIDAALFIKHPQLTTAFIQQVKKMGMGVVAENIDLNLRSQEKLAALDVDLFKIRCPAGNGAAAERLNGDLREAVRGAKALQKQIIAHGVEGADSFAVLWDWQVDYVQGDYIGPADAEPNCDFNNEQTLASDQPGTFNRKAAG